MQLRQLFHEPSQPRAPPAAGLIAYLGFLAEQTERRFLSARHPRKRSALAQPSIDTRKLRGAALDRQKQPDCIHRQIAHSAQLVRQGFGLSRQDGIHQRREIVLLAHRRYRFERLGGDIARMLRAGVEKERELVDFGLRQTHVELDPAGDATGQNVGQTQACFIAHGANRPGHRAQVRGPEHRDQRITALFQQFGGSGLIGRARCHDDNGAGVGAPRLSRLDQRPQRLERFFALNACEDVPIASEQRGRARFIAELRRVGLELATAQIDAFPRFREHLDNAIGRGARPCLVRTAKEEDPARTHGARGIGAELGIRGFHSEEIRAQPAGRARSAQPGRQCGRRFPPPDFRARVVPPR